jgi:hypothetical protein
MKPHFPCWPDAGFTLMAAPSPLCQVKWWSRAAVAGAVVRRRPTNNVVTDNAGVIAFDAPN